MIKIVHICSDEKFINGAMATCALLKGVESVFYVFTKSKKKQLNYISDNSNVIVFTSLKEMLFAINSQSHDVVLLHSLFLPYDFVLKIRKTIIWSTWGNDIYSDRDDPLAKIFTLSLYKPKTRFLLQKVSKNEYKKRMILFVWKKLRLQTKRQKEYNQIAQRANFFSTVLPIEFQNIKRVIPWARCCPFHYYEPKEEYVQPPLATSQFVYNRVLLGNSNDPSNNHFDILEKLNNLGVHLEIVVPFSYPNNCPAYNDLLIRKTSLYKNLNIQFIKGFLDSDEYFRLIDSCSIAIFGHVRQQAVGNIRYCLKTGKKIFFYEDSICYAFFRNIGCMVYSIDNELNKDVLTDPLPIMIQERNREIILNEYDFGKFLDKLQLFFDDLAKEKSF